MQNLIDKLAAYLIPNWRSGWRMFSAQATAALLVWLTLDAETQRLLIDWTPVPQEWVPRVLAALALAGRFVKQPAVTAKKDAQ